MEIGKFKLAKAYLIRPPKKPTSEFLTQEEAEAKSPGLFNAEVNENVVTKNYEAEDYINRVKSYVQSKYIDEDFARRLIEKKLKDMDMTQSDLDTSAINFATGGRVNLAIGGGAIEGEDLGTREGFQKPKKTYTKYEDGKDYDKLKPATLDEQLKIKEEFNKRYNLLKEGKIGAEELFPKVIAKVVYNLPEVKQASDFTAKTRQFLKTLDVYNNEVAPQLKSISAGVGKKKPGLVDLGYTGQPGATILRDPELRVEVKKLAEQDKLSTKAISKILQDKYPGQGGLSLTQVKAAVRGLIEEGDIDPNKVRPSGGQKLTVEEAVERRKILKNLILNTNLSISEIQNKVMSPLGGQTSRSVILDAASDLLTDKQLAKRFESINNDFMNDIKVLDKIIKTPSVQKVINNEDLTKRDRFRFLAEEFSKKVNRPFGSVIGRFNDRLTALGSVYSGTKYYDTKSLDKILTSSITPIKNYNGSNLHKNLLAINSSIKGLNNIDTARMLGISDENIDILRKVQQASKAAFPEFVLQGDHTDIKSLMSNFDNYKDNFMRIQFIKRDLNLWKSSYDREILRLFDLAKQGETIDPKTNLPINDAVQNVKKDFSTKTGGYDLGEFFVDEKGNIKINPKTPIITDLDAPINQTLKQTALNLQTYSAPGGETEVLKNKFDQEYLAAETTKQRENVLEKWKNSKTIKNSRILQGLSNVPGSVGKATKTFLKGGAIISPFVIPSIASADTNEDMLTPVDPGVVVPQENKKEEQVDMGVPPEAIAAGTVGAVKYGPQILKILKNVGLKPFGSVTAGLTYGGMELASDDPSYGLASANLFLPEITGAASKAANITSKTGRFLLNPFTAISSGAATLVPKIMTRAAIPLTIGGGIMDIAKASQPDYLLDKETGEPKAFDREDASFVMPTMIDANQQVSRLAEEKGISYQDAFKELFQNKTFREGIQETVQKYATGGRVNFADGPEDPSKRKFMKIMGGLASLPIVGRFFDVAQVAPVAYDAAKDVGKIIKNAPPHFLGLVNKIRALGKIVDPKKLLYSEQKRYSNVYDYGDYRMFERPDGQIEISKQKFMATDYGDGVVSEEYMSYDPKRPKFNKKGEKIEGEYDEVYEENTTYADQDGEMKDVREGVEPETINDGTFSKEELEQLIIEQIEDSIKKGKK